VQEQPRNLDVGLYPQNCKAGKVPKTIPLYSFRKDKPFTAGKAPKSNLRSNGIMELLQTICFAQKVIIQSALCKQRDQGERDY
jgi:hypothetical protein